MIAGALGRRPRATRYAMPQRAEKDRQQRAVFEPLARLLRLADRQRRRLVRRRPCRPCCAPGRARAPSSSRSRDESSARTTRDHHALPEAERLAERDDAADLQDRRRQRRRRRHDQRGRRREPERPDAADAQVGGRADRAIVRAAHAVGHFLGQQRAEDQAEAPRQQRRQHREQPDERRRASAGLRDLGQASDDREDRRRGRHRVAGEDDERHLHREGDQIPEPGAEPLRALHRRAADEQRGAEDHDDGDRRQRERVGEPMLEPLRQAKAGVRQPRPGTSCPRACSSLRDHRRMISSAPICDWWSASRLAPRCSSLRRERAVRAGPRRGRRRPVPAALCVVSRQRCGSRSRSRGAAIDGAAARARRARDRADDFDGDRPLGRRAARDRRVRHRASRSPMRCRRRRRRRRCAPERPAS